MKLLSSYSSDINRRKDDSVNNLRSASGNRSDKHGGCGNDPKPSENGVELVPRAGKRIKSSNQ